MAVVTTQPELPNRTTGLSALPPIHRVEVRPRRGQVDSRGASVARSIEALGLERKPKRVDHALVYLIEGELTNEELHRIADELLAHPVTQVAEVHSTSRASRPSAAPGVSVVEVHP